MQEHRGRTSMPGSSIDVRPLCSYISYIILILSVYLLSISGTSPQPGINLLYLYLLNMTVKSLAHKIVGDSFNEGSIITDKILVVPARRITAHAGLLQFLL